MKRYFSIKHYLTFLRKQPEHMQHVYAVTFASVITVIFAAVILYVDYGFWHERYDRNEVVTVKDTEVRTDQMVTVQSPGAMISSFFKEASLQLDAINAKGAPFLRGKDEFVRDEAKVDIESGQ